MSVRAAMPHPVKTLGRAVSVRVGSATAGQRQLPSFILVGAQRAGTTSLFRALMSHPLIYSANYHKGVNYFDVNYDRDFSWYQGHFPTAASLRTRSRGADRTSRSPSRPAATTCSTPAPPSGWPTTSRTSGSWRCCATRSSAPSRPTSTSWPGATRPSRSSTALELEDDRLEGEVERMLADSDYQSFSHRHHAYLRRGQYAEQLDRLRSFFPADRIHVIESESFFEQPEDDLRRRARLPGAAGSAARPASTAGTAARAPRCRSRRATRLREHFSSHDQSLADDAGTGSRMAVVTDRRRAAAVVRLHPVRAPAPRSHRPRSWPSGSSPGSAWSLTQPATYSATASVVLTPVPVYVIARRPTSWCRPRSPSTPTPSCSRARGCSTPSARCSASTRTRPASTCRSPPRRTPTSST